MLWKLPASVRCLTYATVRRYGVTAKAALAPEPLSILFCGSDDFSIASLRALAEARREVPDLIQSLDVVHRPAKRTGRGLKHLKEVPIQHVATEELKLETHVIDTFTGWTPPVPVNIIIAVSFGLFVPPRILRLAKYGGINVHPSLLPDLRGPAPIEHALLKRRDRTGVSIQTLHPQHFDHGTILAQTPELCTVVSRDTTSAALAQQLAAAGARMLVDVLKAHKHMPPHEDAGWYTSSNGPIDHAPKITKQDRFIDFSQKTLDDINAAGRALGDLWCFLPNGQRLIIHKLASASNFGAHSQLHTPEQPGIWVQEHVKTPLFRAACGRIGIVESSTYAGSPAGSGNAKLKWIFKAQKTRI